VRRWINAHGGLTRRMIFMQGNALSGIVPSCAGSHEQTVRSHQRYRSTPASYQSARASSDRR
jgi:hypothetical protein